jgi:hypothetical protein
MTVQGSTVEWRQVAERRYQSADGSLTIFGIRTSYHAYGGPDIIWLYHHNIGEGSRPVTSGEFGSLEAARAAAEAIVMQP